MPPLVPTLSPNVDVAAAMRRADLESNHNLIVMNLTRERHLSFRTLT